MSKSVGDKATIPRVFRSLRNRVVSVDSDTSLRATSSMKIELDTIAENDTKTETTSPTTPTKNTITSKIRRRSSQSEINTPVKTPVRRLTRRTSLSEVDNGSNASPLRRSTRKSNVFEENSQTPSSHVKSPITENIALEEDEEDKKDKGDNLSHTIRGRTRASSKSPFTCSVTDEAVFPNQTKIITKSSSSSNISSTADISIGKQNNNNTSKRQTRGNSRSPRSKREIGKVEEDKERIISNDDKDNSIKEKQEIYASKPPPSSSKVNKFVNSIAKDGILNNSEDNDCLSDLQVSENFNSSFSTKTKRGNNDENEPAVRRNTRSVSRSPLISSESSRLITKPQEKLTTNNLDQDSETVNINDVPSMLGRTINKGNLETRIADEMEIISANTNITETKINEVKEDITKQPLLSVRIDNPEIKKIGYKTSSPIKMDGVVHKNIDGDVQKNIAGDVTIRNIEEFEYKYDHVENNEIKFADKLNLSLNQSKNEENENNIGVTFTTVKNTFEHSAESVTEVDSDKINVELSISKSNISELTELKNIHLKPTKNTEEETENENILSETFDKELNTTGKEPYVEIKTHEKIFEHENKNQETVEKPSNLPVQIENENTQWGKNISENAKEKAIVEFLNNKECFGSNSFNDESTNIPSSNVSCYISANILKEATIDVNDNNDEGGTNMKQRNVTFNTTEVIEKSSVIYPKTPTVSKNKSYIEDSLCLSNIPDSTNLPSSSKSRNSNDSTDTVASVHTSIQNGKKLTVSTAGNLKENTEKIVKNTISEKQDIKADQIQSANEQSFSKSWSQAIICNTNECSKKFIDGLELDKMESNVAKKKSIDKVILQSDSDESMYMDEEKEEEERDRSQFVYEEADEVEEYESMDSMDSEDREYLENNEVPVQGESIGSNDTEEEIGTDEEENSMKSFICSSNTSIEELSSDDSFESEEIFRTKKFYIKSSDEESENTDTKRKKRINRKAILIESSDDHEDESEEATSCSGDKIILANNQEHENIQRSGDINDCTEQSNKESIDKVNAIKQTSSKIVSDLEKVTLEIIKGNNNNAHSVKDIDAHNHLEEHSTEESLVQVCSKLNDSAIYLGKDAENITQVNIVPDKKPEALHTNITSTHHIPFQSGLKDESLSEENGNQTILEAVNSNKCKHSSYQEEVMKYKTLTVLDNDNRKEEKNSDENLNTISEICVSEKLTDSEETEKNRSVINANEIQHLQQNDLRARQNSEKSVEGDVIVNKERSSKNHRLESSNDHNSPHEGEDMSKDADDESGGKKDFIEKTCNFKTSSISNTNETFTSELYLDKIFTESENENISECMDNEEQLIRNKNSSFKKVKSKSVFASGEKHKCPNDNYSESKEKQISMKKDLCGVSQKEVNSQKCIEEKNKKCNKSAKSLHLHPIEHILNRCDDILEAINQAKLKANQQRNMKVQKAKQKKSKKEFENISPKSEKFLEPKVSVTSKINDSRNIIFKEKIKQALKFDSSSSEKEYFEQKDHGHKKLKRKRSSDLRVDATFREMAKFDILKGSKKNKKVSADKYHTGSNLTSQKDLNYIKNPSGIFIEEPITPVKRKDLKITSTLELATGTVYEQAITPISERSINGFQESEATPKTLGFKIKRVLSAGQKKTPKIKEQRNLKRKLNLEDSTFSLPKPKWSKSGEFSELRIDDYSQNFVSLNVDESVVTDFSQSKKRTFCPQGQNSKAFDFKTNAFFNKKIKRGTSKELLQRKEKLTAYHNL